MNKVSHTFRKGHTMTTLTIDHDFNTKDVIVQVYDEGDELIFTGVSVRDNQVNVLFDKVPDFDVRVVVIG